ncbi:MAG: hypothetical protein ACLGP3_00570, partial [Acidobacteriota bacterium]
MVSNRTAPVATAPELKEAPTGSPWPILAGTAVLVVGVTYLLKTNPDAGHWAQGYDPVGPWWVSTIL